MELKIISEDERNLEYIIPEITVAPGYDIVLIENPPVETVGKFKWTRIFGRQIEPTTPQGLPFINFNGDHLEPGMNYVWQV